MRAGSDYDAFVEQQIIDVFNNEPKTVREIAEKLDIKYATAYKRLKKMIDRGRVVFNHRNSAHENVYRVATADNLPRIRVGTKPGGATNLVRVDAVLNAYVKNERQGKRTPPITRNTSVYGELLAQFIYTRVDYALGHDDGEDDQVAIEFRKYLVEYLPQLESRIEDIKQLLSHPHLWNDSVIKNWAPSFDTRAMKAYQQLMEEKNG